AGRYDGQPAFLGLRWGDGCLSLVAALAAARQQGRHDSNKNNGGNVRDGGTHDTDLSVLAGFRHDTCIGRVFPLPVFAATQRTKQMAYSRPCSVFTQNCWRCPSVDTRMCSYSVWAPSPSAPRPSSVGRPSAAVKLASLAPPVMGASFRVRPAAAAYAWQRCSKSAVASVRGMG